MNVTQIKLNNNISIPSIGIGTFRLKPDEAENSVYNALINGYRLIDTANFYLNEKAVSRGIKKSGVKREDIFLTSKIFPGYYNLVEKTLDETLKRLNTTYLDLFLLHQPFGNIKKAWQDLELEVKKGKIRFIGISNFSTKQVDKLLTYAKITPTINQVETHPYNSNDNLKKHHEEKGIKIEAWYPLGYMNSKLLNEKIFTELANKYHKSIVQVILRWHIQKGNIVIPGSKNINHIKDNINIFDFELTEKEMNEIKKLDKNKTFLKIPKVMGALFFNTIRFNFDKQK